MSTPRLPTLLALVSLLPVQNLWAQMALRLDTGSVIETSGTGRINLSPERASIRLSVESRDTTAALASSANNARLRRVLDSLNTVHIADSVQVVAVSVRPNQNYQTNVVSGYIASAVVRLTIRSLDRLGQVLDAALGAGATGVAA